jgi:hypothetical protein
MGVPGFDSGIFIHFFKGRENVLYRSLIEKLDNTHCRLKSLCHFCLPMGQAQAANLSTVIGDKSLFIERY